MSLWQLRHFWGYLGDPVSNKTIYGNETNAMYFQYCQTENHIQEAGFPKPFCTVLPHKQFSWPEKDIAFFFAHAVKMCESKESIMHLNNEVGQ